MCPKFGNSDIRPSGSVREVSRSKVNNQHLSKVQAIYGIIIASRAHNLCKSSQSLTLSPVKLVVLFHRIGWTQRFVRTRTLTWALQHFYTLQ